MKKIEENVKKNNCLEKHADSLVSLGLTVLFFIIISIFYDITYELNDDVMILSIISGRIFDTNAASYYLSIELGCILKMLYSFIPNVSWYGLMLTSSYCLSLYFLLKRSFSFFERRKYKIISAIGVILFFSAMFLRYFVLIHYTTCAAMVGAVGIFLMVSSDISKDKKSLIPAIFMFLLSYLIRENIGFIILPFVFISFLYLLVRDEFSSFKKYIPYAVSYLMLFIILLLINRSLPMDANWKDYKVYNDARTEVYDYVGIDNKDIKALEYYEENGLSSEDISLYKSYDVMLDDGDSLNKLEIFADYQNIKDGDESKISKLKNAVYAYYYRMTKEKKDLPFSAIMIILYITLVAIFLYVGNYRYLIIPALTFLFRSILWTYLYYKGRYPDRVLISLFFVEIMLLISVLFDFLYRYNLAKVYKIIIISIFAYSLLLMAIYQETHLYKDYEKQLTVNNKEDVLYLYVDSHPENFYFIDVNSILNRTEKVFGGDSMLHGKKNYLLLGGWVSDHPVTHKLFSDMGCDNAKEAILKNKAYLVTSVGEDIPEKNDFETWLGAEIEVVDNLENDDKEFIIYRVKN